MNDISDVRQMALLGIALAIGLLMGVDRGWKFREAKEGERIAGLRTYGLIGLLGCMTGLISQSLGAVVFGIVFFGFSTVVATAYAMQWSMRGDTSITSTLSMLITFLLGALVAMDYVSLAASAAVITVLLLQFKAVLHGWLRNLEKQELHGILQLLLISVVLLPILPDRGYGPWLAINPYEAWWMVVLIASISFVGYFSMKIAGPKIGVIMTALAAGMVSSTALTLNFSRLCKQQPHIKNLLACGILVACGMMFPRVVLIACLINPALFSTLAMPMAVMTLFTLVFAVVIWHKNDELPAGELASVKNPLELKTALFFGGVLVLVILLGKVALQYFGEMGLYLLALISGIADVDAINLTLSRMSMAELSVDVAVLAIVIASSANTLFKAGLAVFSGGSDLAIRIFLPLSMAACAGLMTIWLL